MNVAVGDGNRSSQQDLISLANEDTEVRVNDGPVNLSSLAISTYVPVRMSLLDFSAAKTQLI
jgi:hypothetical protein